LKIGVAFAKKDSAAGKTQRGNGASAFFVIRANICRHFSDFFWFEIFPQENKLRRSYKKQVAELFEVAAFTAGFAGNSLRGLFNLRIEPTVNLRNFFAGWRITFHFPTIFSDEAIFRFPRG
jgi:intein/homing endonuclease